MKRFCVLLLAAAACNSIETIPATPEIKSSFQTAWTALPETTHAAAGKAVDMLALGREAARARASGDFSTLQGNSLSDFSASFSVPDFSGVAIGASGCIVHDSFGQASFNADGRAGCAAPDHVEVSWPGGDVANVSWTGAQVTVAVVAGDWKGTSVHGAQGHVAGTVLFTATGVATPFRLDADVDWRDSFVAGATVGQFISGNRGSFDGQTTDRVASLRFSSHSTAGGDASGSDLLGFFQGSASVDLLDAAGKTTHTLAWDGIETHDRSHLETVGSAQVPIATLESASGSLLYDGKLVANVEPDSGLASVHWTDGGRALLVPVWPALTHF